MCILSSRFESQGWRISASCRLCLEHGCIIPSVLCVFLASHTKPFYFLTLILCGKKRLVETITWSWWCWRLSVRVGCVAGGPADPEVTFSQWALTADDSSEGRSGMHSLKKGNWNITGPSNLPVSVRFFLRLDRSSEQSFKNACLLSK